MAQEKALIKSIEDEELLFPIDTASYLKSALIKRGWVAVYAISTKERKPTKIGISSDLNGRLSALQTFNWNELYLYYALWLSRKDMAVLIEAIVHLKLEKEKLNREWFNVTPTIAKKIILEAASFHGFTNPVDHKEMVEKAKSQSGMATKPLTFTKNRRIWEELSKSEEFARGPKWHFAPPKRRNYALRAMPLDVDKVVAAAESAEGAATPAEIVEIRLALEDEFNDWRAENDYLLSTGLSGDVFDLRLRLNAAFAKVSSSARSTPGAL